MTGHLLDNPVWSALTTRHAGFAIGGPLARRYPASIVPFAAARDDSAEARAALEALIAPGETVIFAQAGEHRLPDGLAAVTIADAVQMIARERIPVLNDPRVQQLGEADAADMLALATLTRPGPFSLRALSLGEFWGIRINGALVAMAGERMRQPGFTELSGVCAHPDMRGQGLGRTMSLFMAERIFTRGDTPYLHAYAANKAAITLYESIGFHLRSAITVTVAEKAR